MQWYPVIRGNLIIGQQGSGRIPARISEFLDTLPAVNAARVVVVVNDSVLTVIASRAFHCAIQAAVPALTLKVRKSPEFPIVPESTS